MANLVVTTVLSVKKKLEAIAANDQFVNEDDAFTHFKALEASNITVEVLERTLIGTTVNNLRKKMKDSDAGKLAKKLLLNWKKLTDAAGVKNENGESSSTPLVPRPSVSEADDTQGSLEASKGTPVKPEPAKRSLSTSSSASSAGGIDWEQYVTTSGDQVRDGFRKMLANSLFKNLKSKGVDEMVVGELASGLEECLFKEFGETGERYRARIRSRCANVADPRNAELAENIYSGAITVERFAVMSTEELSSKEMKEMREKMSKEILDARMLTFSGGAHTTSLQCSKCKQYDATYSQRQTRSADEPMTTFVRCNKCGHRWKFC